MFQSTAYKHFKAAAIISIAFALIIALFLFSYGKNNSFLVINQWNSPYLDPLFKFWTYLGDGLIWVPVFLYAFFFKRDFLISIIAAIIISTILTHLLKRVIFPGELRPIMILKEQVRTIPGYYINRVNSFPSGHTTTAFTLALLMAFEARRTWCDIVFPLIAFFVGYSRVYLAQHFVTDVLGGVLVGLISASLALWIYAAYKKRKERKKAPNVH